jgi:hypothetical protein
MHPGPMNRGVEIDSQVADGVQSVIREQVEMGVAVRMAVLEALARNLPGGEATLMARKGRGTARLYCQRAAVRSRPGSTTDRRRRVADGR